MKIALIQFSAGADKDANLVKAISFIGRAAQAKARFILLPEVFVFRGKFSEAKNVAEHIPGETTKVLGQLAKLYNVYILAGSIFEKPLSGRKAYNTSVLINPRGKAQAKYRKINLFNACLGATKIKESDNILAGSVPTATEIDGFKVGLSVCYDLRFPEVYRQYFRKNVDIITVPSAFTKKTGEAHWEVLLRARAIENQAFVLAPNQIGRDHRGVETYGCSMVIDPWGEVLAKGSKNKEEIVFADISLDRIKEVQKILPLRK